VKKDTKKLKIYSHREQRLKASNNKFELLLFFLTLTLVYSGNDTG